MKEVNEVLNNTERVLQLNEDYDSYEYRSETFENGEKVYLTSGTSVTVEASN